MPGFTFPTVGPLCISSPPTRYGRSASRTPGTMIRCDCQSPFSELFFPFFSDTLQAPSSVCVPSLSARWTGWKHLPSFARALVFRQYPSSSDDYGKEIIGSPKFPSYPRKYMPRSKTPVVSFTLAYFRVQDCCLPLAARCRLSPILSGLSQCPRLYPFRGSIARPVPLFPSASYSHYWVCT